MSPPSSALRDHRGVPGRVTGDALDLLPAEVRCGARCSSQSERPAGAPIGHPHRPREGLHSRSLVSTGEDRLHVSLTAVLLAAGAPKVTRPKDELQARMAWVEDFSPTQIRFIGATEVSGALGLVLPAVTGIAPVLVPLAATGMAISMALAAVLHLRRGEKPRDHGQRGPVGPCPVVAWGRFGPCAF